MKTRQRVYRFFVWMTVIGLLVSCADPVPGSEPQQEPATNSSVPVPTGTVEPFAHPEPPILVVALPIAYQDLLANYGPYEVASTDLSFARVPVDCNNLFTHGLRAKRVQDFMSHGIDVLALFEAISTGQAIIEKAGISEANGASLGVLITYGSQKVFMIFGGGISKPTIYPLPWLAKGETLSQALANIFDPVKGSFRQAVEITAELTQSVRGLAGCVKDLIQKHIPNTAPQAQPQPVPAPEPVPVPAGTPTAPVPEGAQVNATSSFVTTDAGLLQLDSAEVELLILLGVVVVVAVVVVVLVTGGTAALPLVALAAI